jgi:hypothetical protein
VRFVWLCATLRTKCLVVTTYRHRFLRQDRKSTALDGVTAVGKGIFMFDVTKTLQNGRRGRLGPTGTCSSR